MSISKLFHSLWAGDGERHVLLSFIEETRVPLHHTGINNQKGSDLFTVILKELRVVIPVLILWLRYNSRTQVSAGPTANYIYQYIFLNFLECFQ